MAFTSIDKLPHFGERRKLIVDFRRTNENFEEKFREEIFKAISEENEKEKHNWDFERSSKDDLNPTTISINTKFLWEDYKCGDKIHKGHELLYGMLYKNYWMPRDLEMWEKCNIERPFKKLQKEYLEKFGFFLQDISVANEIHIIISNHAYIREPLWHGLNVIPKDCRLKNEQIENYYNKFGRIFNNKLFFRIACEEYKKDLTEPILKAIPEVLQSSKPINLDVTFLEQKYYRGRNYEFSAKKIHDFRAYKDNNISNPFEELQKQLKEKGYYLYDNRDNCNEKNYGTFRYEAFISGNQSDFKLYVADEAMRFACCTTKHIVYNNDDSNHDLVKWSIGLKKEKLENEKKKN